MCAQAGAQACPSAGVQARAQGRRRTRVPERARVCMYVQVRVCVRMYVCARAWVDSSHPFIYQPPTERVHVSAYGIWRAHNAHVR